MRCTKERCGSYQSQLACEAAAAIELLRTERSELQDTCHKAVMQTYKLARQRDELEKLCNYNERVMQELLQQLDELAAALEKLARLGNEPHYGNSIGNQVAQDALAKVGVGTTARPPTPPGWSDTDWIKHLQEQQHPLAGLHINQGSMDAAADAYEAEYNARHNVEFSGAPQLHRGASLRTTGCAANGDDGEEHEL